MNGTARTYEGNRGRSRCPSPLRIPVAHHSTAPPIHRRREAAPAARSRVPTRLHEPIQRSRSGPAGAPWRRPLARRSRPLTVSSRFGSTFWPLAPAPVGVAFCGKCDKVVSLPSALETEATEAAARHQVSVQARRPQTRGWRRPSTTRGSRAPGAADKPLPKR